MLQNRPYLKATLIFVGGEGALFYCYSFLFLLEGAPSHHGDATLIALSWALIVMMGLTLIWYVRTFNRIATGKTNK